MALFSRIYISTIAIAEGAVGWGVVVVTETETKEFSGSLGKENTLYRAQLSALEKALAYLSRRNIQVTAVISQLVTLTSFVDSWFRKWRDNGFQRADGGEIVNIDIIRRLTPLLNKVSTFCGETKVGCKLHQERSNELARISATARHFKVWRCYHLVDNCSPEK